MSVLASALNKILAHLQEYRPKTVTLLQPGLALEQIQEQVGELPFRLPQEVYELYQWRNGVKIEGYDSIPESMYFIPPHFWFLSLEDAISACKEIEGFRQEYTQQEEADNSHRPWFPIFGSDDLEYFIVLGDEKLQESSPVFYCWLGGGELPKRKYSSLANLLAFVAEAYATGAYYTDFSYDPEHHPDGILAEDDKKIIEIERRFS